MKSYSIKFLSIILSVLILLSILILLNSRIVSAAEGNYSQGFETDTSGWFGGTVNRVASDTGGVPSSGGSWHGITSETVFTEWGG